MYFTDMFLAAIYTCALLLMSAVDTSHGTVTGFIPGVGVQTCDFTREQNFRILSVGNSTVLVGSSECLYAYDLTEDMWTSTPLTVTSSADAECEFRTPDDEENFICTNYITLANQYSPTSYLVCGTYNAIAPRCWLCTYINASLSCEEEGTPDILSREATENYTAILVNDENGDIFLGGTMKFSAQDDRDQPAVARMSASLADLVHSYTDNNYFIMSPHDFVGIPIAYGNFVYFFYREKAVETSNVFNTIYSRVARVCKNDAGGTSPPMTDMFTTFLKTRLICSTGINVQYNEIQDVRQSENDPDIIYGLFTTPNAGETSSAICRYNLAELEELFNEGNRRGQESSDKIWKEVTNRHSDDTLNTRTCVTAYDYANDDIYSHLTRYPLMNKNAANCGLGKTCNDYIARSSDDALAVFPGIRGQKFVVFNDTNDKCSIYVGDNNRKLYRYEINDASAELYESHEIGDCPVSTNTVPDKASDYKWPDSITTLQLNNNVIYGSLDDCLFQITVSDASPPPIVEDELYDRSNDVTYNHTVRIPGAVTNVFKIFEGCGLSVETSCNGSILTCECRSNTFESRNGKFLCVQCIVTGYSDDAEAPSDDIVVLTMDVLSQKGSTVFEVPINIDTSEPTANYLPSDISQFDHNMAEYRLKRDDWLKKSVFIGGENLETCPKNCP